VSSLTTLEMETHRVPFSTSDSVSITYNFSKIPKITATSDNNVNVYLEDVTSTGCTIRTSAKISGIVDVHIIGYIK